jgi:hypothetical protein
MPKTKAALERERQRAISRTTIAVSPPRSSPTREGVWRVMGFVYAILNLKPRREEPKPVEPKPGDKAA